MDVSCSYPHGKMVGVCRVRVSGPCGGCAGTQTFPQRSLPSPRTHLKPANPRTAARQKALAFWAQIRCNSHISHLKLDLFYTTRYQCSATQDNPKSSKKYHTKVYPVEVFINSVPSSLTRFTMSEESASTGTSIEIEVPSVDKRSYKHFTLSSLSVPNNTTDYGSMDVLLISDPDCDKASGACDVHVGQLCDPSHSPGISHFLEHMLFIGSKYCALALALILEISDIVVGAFCVSKQIPYRECLRPVPLNARRK